MQEAIDSGARNVEEIHRSLAGKPFKLLKKIRLSGSAVEKLEDFQDQSIGNVYEFIRSLNDRIGEIATELLKKIDVEKMRPEEPEEEEPPAPTQCMATTKKGTRCKRRPVAGSRYCSIHQPE